MKYAILILLGLAMSPAYAKHEGKTISPSQKTQFEKRFNNELFAKCNPCHKPLESNVVGSRSIPSYIAISDMAENTVKRGIEHGGHHSIADKKKILSVLHPVAETKKAGKKTKKHRKSKKRNNHEGNVQQ